MTLFDPEIPETELRVRSLRAGLTSAQARTLGRALHYLRPADDGSCLVGAVPDSRLAKDLGLTSRTIRNHRRKIAALPWVLLEGTPTGVVWTVRIS